MKRLLSLSLILISFCFQSKAQFNEDQMGAWYMYFYDFNPESSKFGVQGDLQYRNWNTLGDLEQLLIRSGVTYRPEGMGIKFTLGFANITTGAFGESNQTVKENRIYQEALFSNAFGKRIKLTHRFRYEQRWVENQDLRTRYRYNLFWNTALNNKLFTPGCIYLALYNELFINGQRDIGNGNTVEIFDRNRFYTAIGYMIKEGMKVQLGHMLQTTNNWEKGQIQLSFHHNF